MDLSMPISINGRYLGAELTGVQRVAHALVAALDIQLSASELEHWRLLRPIGSTAPPLRRLTTREVGARSGLGWEQLSLPAHVRGDILLNLCNSAPVLHRRNIIMIHDAQVFSSPASYSFAFRSWYKTMFPILVRSGAKVITVSNFSKEMLVAYKVARERDIAVVRNGGDHILGVTADYSRADQVLSDHGPYVLALSSLMNHKNIKVLLEAKHSKSLQGVSLVLAGQTGRQAYLDAGITPPPGVFFTGRVSDGELVGLIRRAQAFVTPSLTEGFGLPPLEAMYLGCPVIVAPTGAMPEVCGEAALYAEPDDPDAWISQILRITTNSTLRTERIAAGLSRAHGFTWSESAQTLVQLINEVRG